MLTKAQTLTLTSGDKVFCTVRGEHYGWWTVEKVRPRDGYIKLAGYWAFCPPHNFSLNGHT
jgi:hypothetical protein